MAGRMPGACQDLGVGWGGWVKIQQGPPEIKIRRVVDAKLQKSWRDSNASMLFFR